MAKTQAFEIKPPNIQTLGVKIKGTAPMIFHKWNDKAIQMMLDKQMKKASAGTRETRNPQKEYEESYYKNAKGEIAFPALCIKQAIIGATRSVEGLPMTLIRGTIFVVGDADGLIKVDYKEERMRQDMVRVGMGSADIRFRGELKDWSMKFLIKFNADVLSTEQVLNLLQIAGFSQGLGEWRPEKNGDFGTFEVA